MRTAQAAGVKLQVSHIIPRRGGPADALERAVGIVDEARNQGMDIAFERAHPPPWNH